MPKHPHQNLKTWIIVHDKSIAKNHAIEAASFAEVVLKIQRAYDNIGVSKYGKNFNKENCRLYIKEIREGSTAIPTFPSIHRKTMDGIDPFVVITTTYETLISTLTSRSEEFQTVLEQEVEEPSARLGVLKSLTFLASSDSYIELKTTIEEPDKGFSVPKYQKNYLEGLIVEYGGTGETTLQGIIVGIRGDTSKYFILNTKNNSNVNCYFPPDMEERIMSLYKKWVIVTGDMFHGQKNAYISHVEELKEHTSEVLHTIGRYPLINPITFVASYDMGDEQWCLCNEELALFGYGHTYTRTIECLEEELEGHIMYYTEYSDEDHAADSLLIKEKLKQHADFDEIKKLLDEKYGGD